MPTQAPRGSTFASRLATAILAGAFPDDVSDLDYAILDLGHLKLKKLVQGASDGSSILLGTSRSLPHRQADKTSSLTRKIFSPIIRSSLGIMASLSSR